LPISVEAERARNLPESENTTPDGYEKRNVRGANKVDACSVEASRRHLSLQASARNPLSLSASQPGPNRNVRAVLESHQERNLTIDRVFLPTDAYHTQRFAGMPRRPVRCPHCRTVFTYAEISASVIAESYRDPFGILARPAISDVDDAQRCPGCGAPTPFRRHEHFYRRE
jgi:hypothetical protein